MYDEKVGLITSDEIRFCVEVGPKELEIQGIDKNSFKGWHKSSVLASASKVPKEDWTEEKIKTQGYSLVDSVIRTLKKRGLITKTENLKKEIS